MIRHSSSGSSALCRHQARSLAAPTARSSQNADLYSRLHLGSSTYRLLAQMRALRTGVRIDKPRQRTRRTYSRDFVSGSVGPAFAAIDLVPGQGSVRGRRRAASRAFFAALLRPLGARLIREGLVGSGEFVDWLAGIGRLTKSAAGTGGEGAWQGRGGR